MSCPSAVLKGHQIVFERRQRREVVRCQDLAFVTDEMALRSEVWSALAKAATVDKLATNRAVNFSRGTLRVPSGVKLNSGALAVRYPFTSGHLARGGGGAGNFHSSEYPVV